MAAVRPSKSRPELAKAKTGTMKNVVRVVSLFYLGQWNQQVFEWAHLYVWQALIMLDVLIVWMIWVRIAGPGAAPPTSP